MGYFLDWRTERDSNPRTAFTVTHFPGVRLQPLGHLSARKEWGQSRLFGACSVSIMPPSRWQWEPSVMAAFLVCSIYLIETTGTVRWRPRLGDVWILTANVTTALVRLLVHCWYHGGNDLRNVCNFNYLDKFRGSSSGTISFQAVSATAPILSQIRSSRVPHIRRPRQPGVWRQSFSCRDRKGSGRQRDVRKGPRNGSYSGPDSFTLCRTVASRIARYEIPIGAPTGKT